MAEKKQWHETLHDQFGQYFAVDNVLYHEKTDHQDLIIFENAAFGRVMALDGVVQTTERDEFISGNLHSGDKWSFCLTSA